jgi:signal transduction histidine kinase
MIEVRDYGIGMSPDEAGRALQPFGQASSVTARSYGGTLIIDTSPGRGTSVRIILPRRPVSADPLGPLLAPESGEPALLPAAESYERVA